MLLQIAKKDDAVLVGDLIGALGVDIDTLGDTPKNLFTLATVGVCVTAAFMTPVLLRLMSVCQLSARRWVFSFVVVISPLVIALLQFATVYYPQYANILWVANSIWEDVAVLCVVLLLLNYIGISTAEQLDAFEQEEHSRVWLPSPVMWPSPLHARRPNETDLTRIWVLVTQFLLVNPTIAILNAYSSVRPGPMVFLAIKLTSFVFAIYAIVVLIQASKLALAGRRPHMKFWVLNVLLVAITVTHHVAERLVHSASIETGGAVATIVAVPFALMMNFAFPTEDFSMGREPSKAMADK